MATTPLCPLEKAEIDGWLEIYGKDVEIAVGVLLVEKQGFGQVHQEQKVKAKESLIKIAKQIDERLKIRTFLVGDRLTAADISLFFSLGAAAQ